MISKSGVCQLHTGTQYESYHGIYEKDRRKGYEDIEYFEILFANALRDPRAVVIVLLDAHFTVIAVECVSVHP